MRRSAVPFFWSGLEDVEKALRNRTYPAIWARYEAFRDEAYPKELQRIACAQLGNFFLGGLMTCGFAILFQCLVRESEVFRSSALFLAFLLVLCLFWKRDSSGMFRRHPQIFLYGCLSLLYLASVLMGTFWDPDAQAITFMIAFAGTQFFIVDRTLRVLLFDIGWSAFFLVCSFLAKPWSLFEADAMHLATAAAAAFPIAILATGGYDLVIKRELIGDYFATHEQHTGLQTREMLRPAAERFTGQLLFAAVAEAPSCRMLLDAKGPEEEEKAFLHFAGVLQARFGEKNCFHYFGGTILVLVTGTSEGALLQELRKSMQESERPDFSIYAVYVFGTCAGERDLWDMVRAADRHCRDAQHAPGGICGSFYDRDSA